tara:strand:+ start:105 stop:434 length:330 start_codon:yes stop_codon:yes gene_type:complete
MSVQLLLLKSGEDVVADIQEMVVEEKVVGYYLKYPCRAQLVTPNSTSDTSIGAKIQLTPWMPLAKDKVIPVVSDWVVTIANPVGQLENMYLEATAKYEEREREAPGPDQ